MPFFYYKKNFASKWVPIKDTFRPGKVAEGSAPKTTNLQELTEAQAELDLGALMLLFPAPDQNVPKAPYYCPVCKAPVSDDHHEECPRAIKEGEALSLDRPGVGE